MKLLLCVLYSTLTMCLIGPAHAQSGFGTALAFDGSGQFVSIPSFGNIIPTNEVTVEFWAYTTTAAAQSAFLLQPDLNDNRFNFHLNFGNPPSSGIANWDFGNTAGAGRLSVSEPENTITNWIHYALVASQIENYMRIYTNGVLMASQTGMTPFVRGNFDLRIGGSAFAYNGMLDDFRVWNIARSQAQIQAGSKAPLFGNEPNLLVYYRFDSTNGPVATNSAVATGSAYNGLLSKNPLWVSGVPGTPSVMSQSAFASNTVAVLRATANPGNPPGSVWFEWGRVGSYYTERTAPVPSGIGSATLSVSNIFSGLTPGFNYHCRAVASNSLGIALGADLVFGAPGIVLHGGAVMSNECHTVFTSPAVSVAPSAITAGSFHNLAVKSDGTAGAWGNNAYGQSTVPVGLSNVVAVAAGYLFSVALKNDGTVAAWGFNSLGQTDVPLGLSNVVSIASGDNHSLALKSDGTVLAWGYNTDGVTVVPPSLTNVVAIAAGAFHSLAVKADGTLVGWGRNWDGQTTIPAGLSNVIAVAGGGAHSLALRSDGKVVAWGYNADGETTIPLGLSNVVAIASGATHNLALKSDGVVVAWGFNNSGQTTIIPVTLSNVVAIAAGDQHSLALRADGMIASWGNNTHGQITAPTDLSQSNLTAVGTINTNLPGTYKLNYSTTNYLGGISSATRTVVVADTIGPVVTIVGPNPITFTNANRSYADLGATSLDACGGAFTVSVLTNTVNVNFPGTYFISYKSIDSYGNASTNTRTVFVALPPKVAGDLNGDGRVSQSELSAIYGNYITNGSGLSLTNVAGLGGSTVTFGLGSPGLGGYSVQYSSNLVNWLPLGPAVPRYQFTDTNVSAGAQRFYRITYP